MFPTISLGAAVIPTAPLIYIFGIYLTLDLVERFAKRLGHDGANWYVVLFNGLVVGFIAARLAFVLQNLPAFRRQPISIIWPLTAGFVPWVGLLIGAIMMLWQMRRHNLSLWLGLDVLTPTFSLLLGVIALADFLGGSGFGTETTLPWRIMRAAVARHPVQLYEGLVSLTALLIWGWLSRPKELSTGRIGLITLAVYSAGRLFVDAFRANAPIVGDGFHLTQIISLLLLLLSLFLLANKAGSKQFLVVNGA